MSHRASAFRETPVCPCALGLSAFHLSTREEKSAKVFSSEKAQLRNKTVTIFGVDSKREQMAVTAPGTLPCVLLLYLSRLPPVSTRALGLLPSHLAGQTHGEAATLPPLGLVLSCTYPRAPRLSVQLLSPGDRTPHRLSTPPRRVMPSAIRGHDGESQPHGQTSARSAAEARRTSVQ